MEENKLITISEIENLRKNISFHFTDISNLESILNEGLRPKIGNNAKGGLGQAAIEKTYVSYGIEGALQLVNRAFNMLERLPIGILINGPYSKFLPESIKEKITNEKLLNDEKEDILNSFLTLDQRYELVRQYMKNNTYLFIDTNISEYERNISDDELEEINNNILNSKLEDETNLKSTFDKLNAEIMYLEKNGRSDETSELVKKRDGISLKVLNETKEVINSKRGKILNISENTIIDEVDFDDESLTWKNQVKNLSNIHTRIIQEQDGKFKRNSNNTRYDFSIFN